jgi:uncharacterized membrane protein YphA (DoxX/SURF4 family)
VEDALLPSDDYTNMEPGIMTENQLRSYGVFLLRVALGVMFLAHSVVYMLLTLTLPGTAKFFVSIGLSAWLAYATFLAEALGGILLVLGIQTRWVALFLSPILIGATWAHAGNGWLFAPRTVDGNTPSISSFSALRKPCSATAPTRLPRRACPMPVQVARRQSLRSDSGLP